MKIIIAEQDPILGTSIKKTLTKAGLIVDLVQYSCDAESLLNLVLYDALILNINANDTENRGILNLAIKKEIPCLVTSNVTGLQHCLDVLNLGAEDYICKPFDIKEVEARLKVILRRPRQHLHQQVHFANISFNLFANQIKVNGKEVILARREAALFGILITSAPRITKKSHLENVLYSVEEETSLNAVEALVSRVRRKLKNFDCQCNIETVRGVGYRLVKKSPPE